MTCVAFRDSIAPDPSYHPLIKPEGVADTNEQTNGGGVPDGGAGVDGKSKDVSHDEQQSELRSQLSRCRSRKCLSVEFAHNFQQRYRTPKGRDVVFVANGTAPHLDVP